VETTRLAAVLEAVSDGIAVLDAQGNLILANAAQAQINGFETVDEMLRNLSFYAEVYELHDLQGQRVPFEEWPAARGLRGETIQNWVLLARRRDLGREWYFSFSVEPVRDPRGAVTMVVVVTRDITEAHALTQALRESEQRLSTIHDAAPFGIAITRLADGAITSVNDAFAELHETTREEVLGRTGVGSGVVEAVTRQRLLEALERDGRLRDVETTRRARNGELRTLSLNVDRLELNGEPVLLTTVLDVTARKRAEQSLRESQARYRALFDQAAMGVALVETTTSRFLEVNARMCAMLGYERAALLEAGWQAITHPDDLVESVRSVERMVQTQAPYVIEKRYLRRDGSVMWGRVTISPVNLPETPMTTQIAMIEDITQQRLLTEQLHQAQKLDSIGRLAGGVAHDFNNLLTVILSCAEALQADLSAGATPNREDADEIAIAGQRARELTRQLLAFARRELIEPVAVDLNEVVQGSQKLLGRLVGEDVELRTELTAGCWRAWADFGQLEQVLMNLAVNARDAMPRGGVLTFATRNVVDHPLPGEWVELEVRDTGEGMPDEVKAHLFEPFFTTKGRGRGTGLGLATVYGIVTGAGGRLFVESAVGQGSTFRVLLPRTTRIATAPDGRPELALRGGTESVLVAEDDPQVRAITVRTLEDAGYRVKTAERPASLLTIPDAELANVQLLVTDVVMPGLDGAALAERLRTASPKLRVLYVSGHTRDVVQARGLTEKIEFLAKPFTPATLLAKVRAVLDR
jgi:PAS domain S-box-containing protein